MVLIPPGAVGLKFWSLRTEQPDVVIGTVLAADPDSYSLTGTDVLLPKLFPAAWNSADKSANVTLSNSDKTATLSSSVVAGVRSNRKNANGVAGKYYAEFLINSPGAGVRVGVSNSTLDVDLVA